MAFHQQGQNTLKISMQLFKNNRLRVIQALKETKKISNEASTYIFLQGGFEDAFGFYDTDINQTTFRQVNTVVLSTFSEILQNNLF